ncbi:MAG: DUF2807 domain-containing protein [Bacteroidales bacterium]|nr:DUF2807 domain-containing protein [Bacteroidales bacterium]MDD4475971.1 DUF2807 domain-containing protein [Eubacteriales bacterium]
MKKVILTIAAIIALSFTLNAGTVTKSFNNKGFKGLDVSFRFDAEVIQSDKYSVVLEFEEEYAKYLVVKQSGDVLHIKFEDLPRKLQSTDQHDVFKATISMPVLEYLSMSGACKFNTTSKFDLGSNPFTAKISGASRINNLEMRASDARIYLSGASSMTMVGDFTNVNMELSGACHADFDVVADELDTEVSGASKVQIKANVNKLDVECSGASKAQIEGKTRELDIECSGACSVNTENLVAEDVSVDCSGASKARVRVLKSLDVDLSGASSCYYNADNGIDLTMDISRGSSLKRVK